VDIFFKTIYEINKKRKKQKIKKTIMKEHQDITKLEFLMTVNNNFIVQRFFNVKGYNPKSHCSVELMDVIQEFVDTLKYDFKMKTVSYMLDNQYQITEDPEVLNTSFTDGPEVFNIYIKNGDNTLYHYTFDAKLYPPKIRYTVDVRPFLKNILAGLTETLSSKKLTYNYLGYELVR
jgi:hypothetical protein